MIVWRIVKEKHGATAFSGIGASIAPGRWNSLGIHMAYAAANRATAMMEVVVHASRALLKGKFVIVSADIPDSEIAADFGVPLPPQWDALVPPLQCSAIGDAWIASGSSLAVKVPSVAAPGETNVLINPRHPRFAQVVLGTPEPLTFDARIKGPVKPSRGVVLVHIKSVKTKTGKKVFRIKAMKRPRKP